MRQDDVIPALERHELPVSHHPFLTMPEKLVEVLVEVSS